MRGCTKTKWIVLTGAAILVVVGWTQADRIQSWYYVRQLCAAREPSRDAWVTRTASLGDAALPRLLDALCESNTTACGNVQRCLVEMVKTWEPTNQRTTHLLQRCHRHFEQCSLAGQKSIVELTTEILQINQTRPLPPRMTTIAAEILVLAEKNVDLRASALGLAAELVDAVEPGQWVDVSLAMAERGLNEKAGATQAAALRLLMREPMRKHPATLEKAVPCLGHSEPAVRKAALLLLAAERDLARDEALLPLLHDDDVELQFLCENALRKRGLTDDDIKLGRMLSDRDPVMRMRVLYQLYRVPDVNHASLLDVLSRDASAPVRAAAARAAAENPAVDLAPRLREMAASDPSETVRQIAQYHLLQRPQRAARE